MSLELIRIVDGLAREKNIDKELVIADLEEAMKSAIRKKYDQEEGVEVAIDRISGDISASLDDEPIDMNDLGRIAAQTAKQVMIQRIREAERGSIYEEFVDRKLTIITGAVARFEGGALVVNIGRTEGFLPRSEQIPGEAHQPGERIRTLILDVREAPHQVKIILSRSHPDFIRRLFELEVPEVAERIIEIKALAREAGYRTKVAVSSIDTRVDAVGACVGVRGSRIKNIVEELGGEKIDIVRWNESSQILIGNALKPAEIQDTALCFEMGRATVVVPEDQLSLAIGKRGQNVRLAARLTGWDIDILTPKEYNRGLDRLAATLRKVEGVDEVMAERVSLLGLISVMDVEEVGSAPLVKELELEQELAEQIVQICSDEAKIVQTELAKEKEEKERERAEQQKAEQAAAAGEADGASDAASDAASDDAAKETTDGTADEASDAEVDDAGETASETGSAEGDAAAAETPSSDSQVEAEPPDAEPQAVDEAAAQADATEPSQALSPEAETEAKADGDADGESPMSPSAAVGDAETSPTD